MATDYSAIVAALDAAILANAGKPTSITINGRTYQYRSLDELTAAREKFAALAATSSLGRGFKITALKNSGARA